jgi:hypothetical protein
MSTLTLKTIDYIDRLKSSSNGGPRFKIRFTDGTCGITRSGSSFAYSIGNPGYRTGSQVQVGWSRGGRISEIWSVA